MQLQADSKRARTKFARDIILGLDQVGRALVTFKISKIFPFAYLQALSESRFYDDISFTKPLDSVERLEYQTNV